MPLTCLPKVTRAQSLGPLAAASLLLATLGVPAAAQTYGPPTYQGPQYQTSSYPVPANQDPAVLADRLLRLEQELRDLQAQVNRGRPSTLADPEDGTTGGLDPNAGPAAAPTPLPAGATTRLDDMEQTLRRLTGQVEQMVIDVRQMRDTNELFRKETQFRLGALEGGAPASLPTTALPGAAPQAVVQPNAGRPGLAPQPGVLGTLPQPAPAGQTSSGPTPQSPAPTAALPPEEQYKAALSLLGRQQYDEAQNAFRQVATQHPKHELAGSSLYFAADIDFVKKAYAEAAKGFTGVLRTYPKNTRAPDAMLKLGLSLIQLNNKNDGCLTLGAIKGKYPQANPQVLDRATRARQQFACK